MAVWHKGLELGHKLAIFQLLTVADVQKLEVGGLPGQTYHRAGGNVPRSHDVELAQCGKQVFSDSIDVPI